MTTALAPITRQTVGRTFIVAISLLGIGAALQLSVVVWRFTVQFHAGPPQRIAVQNLPGEGGPSAVAPQTPGLSDLSDPFAESPAAATPSTGPRVPTRPTKPTPVPANALTLPQENVDQERFNELIEQARTLRQRGDNYSAVTRLREAQAMNETSPIPPSELALTYEKMGFTDRAAEQWRAVYNMGEAAGIYWAAADGKLKLSQAQALKQAQKTLQPAPAATTSPGEKVGLSPESKLGLMEVTRRDESDAASARKFTLIVPVKAKPKARIDVREVIVQVLFYDAVNNRALERTTAAVSYKWADPPADWSDGDLEQLEVSYNLPALHVADEERKYYGYVVSVYYKNALQDFRADPPALGQRAPPPKQLATDSADK